MLRKTDGATGSSVHLIDFAVFYAAKDDLRRAGNVPKALSASQLIADHPKRGGFVREKKSWIRTNNS